MDVTKQAIAYAFFYLDDEALKVDYGAYTPGAVPAGAITDTLTKGQTPMSLCPLALPNGAAFQESFRRHRLIYLGTRLCLTADNF